MKVFIRYWWVRGSEDFFVVKEEGIGRFFEGGSCRENKEVVIDKINGKGGSFFGVFGMYYLNFIIN